MKLLLPTPLSTPPPDARTVLSRGVPVNNLAFRLRASSPKTRFPLELYITQPGAAMTQSCTHTTPVGMGFFFF